jgi:hypothetical protein
MEIRWQNRPVSMTVVSGLLTLDMRPSVTGSAKPCARDPPRRAARVTALPGPAGGRATASPPGEDLPTPEATKRREAMQQHRLSRRPDSQS